jgi:transcriptional regulator with PAS, ATPase and Fis domain
MKYTMDDIKGEDEQITKVKDLALKAAHSESPVLLQGESGTGKELFAHAIHNASRRRTGPFIRVNCAAIPDTLIEAELFGYIKGAFTGAVGLGNPGKFELADKGTIFLDEVEEMPLSMQPKLLRVLDDKEISPLGSKTPKTVDFRLISATNQNLENMVRENNFRLDLFYRLNVIRIELPPLREMKSSIDSICRHLIQKKSKEIGAAAVTISSDVMNLFKKYVWPGNVRELANIIESAINICDGKIITLTDLPKHFLEKFQQNEENKLHKKLGILLKEREEQIIRETLKETGNNKRQAAKILGIHRSCLYQKLNRHSMKSLTL